MIRRLVSASLCSLALCLCVHAAHAQGTKLWSESKFDEFERGKPDGVAIQSDGHLAAGPATHSVFTSESTYVWSVAADKAGNAYLGTGSPATVLRVTPDGKSTTLFTTKDLSVQVVRVGPDGSIYAATLPSGKVYKLAPDAKGLDESKAQVIFDPAKTDGKAKYIWDMAFDAAGRLYVATGGPAAIYRVNTAQPDAKPELFFSSDEEHIRALAFAANGDLIAGTDGTGLIYRIDKQGKGFVLFNAPKREITSLAIGANGSIYASAVGEKGKSTLPPLPVQGNPNVTATITIVQPGSVQAFNGNTVVPDGSEIYEIVPQGAPRRLWAGHDDVVYALRSTPDGLLAATGNRGRIYRIGEDGEYADIAHLEAGQAVGFADTPRALYIGTSNTGRLYSLDHSAAASGTYLSDIFDAGFVSQWGRPEVDNGPGSNASNYDLYARVGNVDNPERGWSDWKKIAPADNLGLEPARFVQWKAVLHPGASIGSIGINYLPVNVAPVVDEVLVAPGVRINAAAQQQQQPQPVIINLPSVQSNTVSFNQEPGKEPLTGFKDKTAITVRWAAHDDNGDDLIFAIYYRGHGETNWQLLKGRLTDRWYTFDAALLPDGPYRLKVVASDAPSHPAGEELKGDRSSDRFLVDTTPPALTGMTAQMVNGKIHASLTATDIATPIAHAEYSVDAGPWQYLEPVGKMSDALVEKYDFLAPLTTPGEKTMHPSDSAEHVITVRVYDRYDNVSAVKAVVR
ncbi:hypothetical protein [Acidipila rosea]|uniref:Sugar lactone lactonase YvrE n=1 Tax=Acidipila rosea TaxID=768535 RepID=A0A4R1L5V4_9BACT|nr:hypothetical protein [Acidipila rosea]TCK73515.1 hypothetical protein C7378_1128 [Acidipila rosea]